ncbi:hypothetical protein BGX30_006289, partial [Mortierella sp. GBA39]
MNRFRYRIDFDGIKCAEMIRKLAMIQRLFMKILRRYGTAHFEKMVKPLHGPVFVVSGILNLSLMIRAANETVSFAHAFRRGVDDTETAFSIQKRD